MSGRSIRIFLVDGTASGLRTAEIGLSTIKAVVVPRASLAMASKRPELSRTGVYVLVGPDSDRAGGRKVYIGEGDTIVTRLTTHNKDPDKDFWTEVVVLVSKDENLTKGHVRFLEARLIKLASDAKRSAVTNGTAPSDLGKLPEPDEVEMGEFIEQARLLLGALGYDIFEPTVPFESRPASTSVNQDEFEYEGDGFSATCVVNSEAGQFIVKAGSFARREEATSFRTTYHDMRTTLIDSGVLKEENGHYLFTQDFAFGAASAAAAVVSGQSVNGRTAWKLKGGGETFAEWEDKRLPTEDSATASQNAR